ncbi:MAG: hypothetical protein QXT67_08145 [Candidatus Bathyarchaeia archaeon]
MLNLRSYTDDGVKPKWISEIKRKILESCPRVIVGVRKLHTSTSINSA